MAPAAPPAPPLPRLRCRLRHRAPRARAARRASLPERQRPCPRRSPAAKAAPAPTAPPAVSTASGGTYTVKSGDTLGKIANQNRGAASLDQMLVALFKRQPGRFHQQEHEPAARRGAAHDPDSNAEAAAMSGADARQEVVAQSADFAQYRSRLAQAAGGSCAGGQGAAAAARRRAGHHQGRRQQRHRETGGDQLKIAKAETKAAAAAASAAKADEAASPRQRAAEGRAGARGPAEEDERGDPEGARSCRARPVHRPRSRPNRPRRHRLRRRRQHRLRLRRPPRRPQSPRRPAPAGA